MDDRAAARRFKDAAVAEATRFLEARRQWLTPTSFNWSDIDKRYEIITRLGYPLRYRFASGRYLGLPDRPTVMEIYFPSRQILSVSDAEAAVIFSRLIKPEVLPRGRGRYQKGTLGPRNVAIRGAIECVAKRYGLKPVGSEKKDFSLTASAVVCAALRSLGVYLKRRSIEDIWSDRL
jgi:hypothetical protein